MLPLGGGEVMGGSLLTSGNLPTASKLKKSGMSSVQMEDSLVSKSTIKTL